MNKCIDLLPPVKSPSSHIRRLWIQVSTYAIDFSGSTVSVAFDRLTVGIGVMAGATVDVVATLGASVAVTETVGLLPEIGVGG